MKVEEETDCKKKLDEQKNSLQRLLRDIEKFANMDLVFRDRQKEKWKEELQEIERKKKKHKKMQKRSQKMQSLQDKKKKYLKDGADCEEEMRMIHGKIKKGRRVSRRVFRRMWKKEKRKKNGKETWTRRRRQMIGMKALQWWKLWRKNYRHTKKWKTTS